MTLIRYYGHVGQRTGYGKAATDLCLALHRAGVEIEIRPLCAVDQIDVALCAPLAPFMRHDDALSPTPDAVIVHTLPYDCRRVYDIAGLDDLDAAIERVAYTTWEAASPPPSLGVLLAGNQDAVFDAVWVPSSSSHITATREDGEDIPSLIVPHCFDEMRLAREPSTAPERERYTFYYAGMWSARKNVAGLVVAFLHAFTRADEVELLLHCPGADPAVLGLVRACSGVPPEDQPKITLSTSWVSDTDMSELHQQADCFVTASNGEAWNLPAFDAYLAGRMCIVPKGHGSDEYLHGPDGPDNARLVGWNYAPAFLDAFPGDQPGAYRVRGGQGLSARLVWRATDILGLAEAMRETFDAKTRHLNTRGGVDPNASRRFGYAAVAKQALAALGLAPGLVL